MSRVRLLVTILPSMVAGGFLFASEFGHAEAGRDGALGFWPVSSDTATGSVILAQADPRPRRPRPPVPPAPPAPPAPPEPPDPPATRFGGAGGGAGAGAGAGAGSRRGRGHGMSVSIHDGKIEIDGIEDMVQDQLEGVLRVLDNLHDVPPDVRDRVKGRVKSVRDKLKVRLGRLKSMDLDKIGPEMERMGDEIEKDMEGLDNDLERLGDKMSKHFAEKFGKDFAKSFSGHVSGSDDSNDDSDDDSDDDDDKDAVALPQDSDTDMIDPADLRAKLGDLKNLKLNQKQKDKLAQLRLESDQQVASAKHELDEMSRKLRESLGDSAARESDIERQIDQISAREAVIRKARILAWLRARKVLDGDQRKLVEAAAKKTP